MRRRAVAGLALAGLFTAGVPVLTGGIASAQSTVQLPSAPTNVSATIVDGVATVTWTPATTGGAPLQGYTVLPSAGCPVQVPATATSATVTGLPATGTVTFQVAASTSAGFSPYSAASAAVATSARGDGYRLVAADGGVFNFGTGSFRGAPTDIISSAAVDGVETPSGNGYWVVARDGAVYAYGGARYFGGANTLPLNAPIVGVSRTGDGLGYVLAASDGGVFAYGSARFVGSAGSIRLNSPVVAVAATPSGSGYLLAAADGGVFAYGDAQFRGSAVGLATAPVVDIEMTQTGRGYWILAADGAVYAYGDARFLGAPNTVAMSGRAEGITASGTDRGYLVVTDEGAVYAYGDARFVGGANGSRLAAPVVAITATKPAADPAVLQFLQLSDFHGQVEVNGSVGGAGVLSTLWQQERARIPATFTMNSGDNYGAAPAISSFFNEIPTVRAMNIMRFDVNGFGNHEFDKSLSDLNAQLAESEAPWVLANHTNVAANIAGWGPSNRNPIRPYEIVEKGGVRVAFVGVNTPETPGLVSPGSLGTMTVTDPAAAVNRYAAEARAAGADVVVVLAHFGTNAANLTAGSNIPTTPGGALPDLARTTSGVDLYYGGHTHLDFQATVNGRLVQQTTNGSGRYTRTRMCVDPTTRGVAGVAGQSVVPTATGVTPDPAVNAMLQPFRTQLQAILDPVIGTATALLERGNTVTVTNPAGGTATPAVERAREVAVGNLVADAMRVTYGTQVAIMNGGGLRSPLPSSYAPANTALRRQTAAGGPFQQGPPFDIVLGDIYTLLPFGNIVVTKSVTGSTLWAALENGVSRWPASDGRFPQVSGMRYTFDPRLPAGSRITSLELNTGGGFTSIPKDGTLYTLAINDFMNQGGDGYTVFDDGTGISRDSLAAVTAAYVSGPLGGTINPSTLVVTGSPRITNLAP